MHGARRRRSRYGRGKADIIRSKIPLGRPPKPKKRKRKRRSSGKSRSASDDEHKQSTRRCKTKCSSHKPTRRVPPFTPCPPPPPVLPGRSPVPLRGGYRRPFKQRHYHEDRSCCGRHGRRKKANKSSSITNGHNKDGLPTDLLPQAPAIPFVTSTNQLVFLQLPSEFSVTLTSILNSGHFYVITSSQLLAQFLRPTTSSHSIIPFTPGPYIPTSYCPSLRRPSTTTIEIMPSSSAVYSTSICTDICIFQQQHHNVSFTSTFTSAFISSTFSISTSFQYLVRGRTMQQHSWLGLSASFPFGNIMPCSTS